MERTQIYMTEEQKLSLAILSEKTGDSQSVLIRKALDEYLAKESRGRIENQKDFWSAHVGSWEGEESSSDYVEKMRAGADSRLHGLYGGLSESSSGGFAHGAPSGGKGGKGKGRK